MDLSRKLNDEGVEEMCTNEPSTGEDGRERYPRD